jgi:hypothetical protein
MRFWLSFLLSFIILPVVGQSTPEKGTVFISNRVNSLNIKIWEQLSIGHLTGYNSDSLASQLTFKDIIERSTTTAITTRKVQSSEFPLYADALVAEEVSTPFDASKDFKGLSLSYEYNYVNGTAGFTLRAVAPLYNLVLPEGIDLGLQPLCWINTDDLFSILSDEEATFYNALFAARMQMGDFSNPYFYPSRFSDGVIAQGEDLASKSVFEDYHFHHINEQTDSVLGNYLHSLMPFAATKAEQNGTAFFKDVDFIKKYANLGKDLSLIFNVDVPDPDHPEDPYEFVSVSVYATFEFTSNLSYEMISSDDKKIVRFFSEEVLGENSVYIELTELEKFMKPYDKSLLDAYLNWDN